MHYKIELIHSEEGYAVGCPEVPGCWSEGRTEEEAITNNMFAIFDYLSVVKAMRREEEIEKTLFVNVPEPILPGRLHDLKSQSRSKLFRLTSPFRTSLKLKTFLTSWKGRIGDDRC